MKKEIIEEVIPFIKEWVRFVGFHEKVPGISVAMQLDKDLLMDFSVGKKNLETGDPLTTDTLFRIASHSKLFTATGIMELYAQDKLSLDDRVSKYLTWFKPKNDNIRIKHLLNHTGGISRDTEFGQWDTLEFPTEKEFEKLVEEGVEVLDPALQIKYSNIAYTMLGRILEKVSGLKYEEYMYDLCKRLGMNNTYPEIGEHSDRHTRGYNHALPNEEKTPYPDVEARSMNPATGFSSTASDLMKFYYAHLPEVDAGLKYGDYIKQEMHNQTFSTGDAKWGIGFSITKYGEITLRGHGGGYPGYITNSGFERKSKIILAVLTNTLFPPTYLFSGILTMISYANSEYENYETDPKNDFTKYEGIYRGHWSLLYVKQLAGKLMLIPMIGALVPQMITRLSYIENDTFKIEKTSPFGSPGQKVEFVNGELHMGGSVLKKYSFNY
ncbi:MAG: serine hydrolase domain-containing protein [Candidatus Kariarchaeaceae archaeon]